MLMHQINEFGLAINLLVIFIILFAVYAGFLKILIIYFRMPYNVYYNFRTVQKVRFFGSGLPRFNQEFSGRLGLKRSVFSGSGLSHFNR